jgi:hypothetical protein
LHFKSLKLNRNNETKFFKTLEIRIRMKSRSVLSTRAIPVSSHGSVISTAWSIYS